MNLETRLVGDHLLTVNQVANLLHVSKRTVWRWVAQGRVPTPIRYSKTCVRWKASVLQAYLEALQPPGLPAVVLGLEKTALPQPHTAAAQSTL